MELKEQIDTRVAGTLIRALEKLNTEELKDVITEAASAALPRTTEELKAIVYPLHQEVRKLSHTLYQFTRLVYQTHKIDDTQFVELMAIAGLPMRVSMYDPEGATKGIVPTWVTWGNEDPSSALKFMSDWYSSDNPIVNQMSEEASKAKSN